MAGLGKKILSAFVEVTDSKTSGADKPKEAAPTTVTAGHYPAPESDTQRNTAGNGVLAPPPDSRFSTYFDQLFSEANIPGPDYYEFAKMTGAMQTIADERSRFRAAYAGLQVQGLDRARLLSTAGEYLKVLETDASRFHSTVDTTLQEKVRDKESGVEEKNRRMLSLSQEISELQQQIAALQAEIAENKEKIEASTGGYTAESERRKAGILSDIEKIKHHIQ